jgi:hypothetical protein
MFHKHFLFPGGFRTRDNSWADEIIIIALKNPSSNGHLLQKNGLSAHSFTERSHNLIFFHLGLFSKTIQRFGKTPRGAIHNPSYMASTKISTAREISSSL